MLLDLYYAIYLGSSTIVIGAAGCIFHRSGAVFLNNAFACNRTLARAVARLLDMGFYLLSLGYVGLSCMVNHWEVRDCEDLVKMIVTKVGGLLVLMGAGHTFNLLVLALFRSRSARQYSSEA
jgi:hypothetical protein